MKKIFICTALIALAIASCTSSTTSESTTSDTTTHAVDSIPHVDIRAIDSVK
jgi:outer membrane lipoprotein SlyB